MASINTFSVSEGDPENVASKPTENAPALPSTTQQKFPPMVGRNIQEHLDLVEEMVPRKFIPFYNAMANGDQRALRWYVWSNIDYAQHNNTYAYPLCGLLRDKQGELQILHAIGKVKIPNSRSFWNGKWVGHVGDDFSNNYYNLQPVLLPPNFFKTTTFYHDPEDWYEMYNRNKMGSVIQKVKDDLMVIEGSTPKMLFLPPSIAADFFAESHLTVGKVYQYFKDMEDDNQLEPLFKEYVKPFVFGLIHKNTANVNIPHRFFDDEFNEWRKNLLYCHYGDPANCNFDTNDKINNTVYHLEVKEDKKEETEENDDDVDEDGEDDYAVV